MDSKIYLKFWLKTLFAKLRLPVRNIITVHQLEHTLPKNTKLVIFDVDDTLTDFLGLIPEDVVNFLKALQSKGLNIAVFSNSSPKRTQELDEFFAPLKIYNVQRSDKPNPAGYLEILKFFGIEAQHTAMVGDKIGTDLYGAYLAGIKDLYWVEPVSNLNKNRKPSVIDRFGRWLERKIYK